MSNQKSCYKLNVWENILMHLSSLNNIIDVFVMRFLQLISLLQYVPAYTQSERFTVHDQ